MDKLLKQFKNTDWSETPIYSHFNAFGAKWINIKQTIYTEQEITTMVNKVSN